MNGKTNIIIAGVGGGGGNAINYMKEKKVEGVKFIAYNTDFQDLEQKSSADEKVRLGEDGLGAGSKPEVARQAAEDTRREIEKSISDADMVFITAGMGGGTGTGASPVIAKIAKEAGKLTVAIVTKPFDFEGHKKMKLALGGIEELRKYVDALIVIPNQKIFSLKSVSIIHAYLAVNEVLRIGVTTITDLITKQALVNLDYNDVKTVLENSGVAMFGFGSVPANHDNMEELVNKATENPLLEEKMTGARNVLVNFSIPATVDADKFEEITRLIREKIEIEDDQFIHGIALNEKDEIQISIIASNFEKYSQKEVKEVHIDNSSIQSDEQTKEQSKQFSYILPEYEF